MYKLLLFFALLFCFQSDSEITWKPSNRLTWQDFKGKPNKNSDAVAITASGITFGYSIQKSSITGVTGFKTKVSANFYPEHSWCKKELVDNHILQHEQLHFDITELNTRYLKQEIAKLKPTKNIAQVLNKLHREANNKLEKMQEKYDLETNYSINKEEQYRWNNYVETQLNHTKYIAQ